MAYDVEDLSAPRATGGMLRAFVLALESSVTGPVLAKQLLSNLGIAAIREVAAPEAHPLQPPLLTFAGDSEASPGDPAELLAGLPEQDVIEKAEFPMETAADFVAAYREGTVTPAQVAQRVVELTRASDDREPPMRIFIAQNEADILEQAQAATARYEKGEPLGPFDGVPVAVKDEVDQRPYPTTVGTAFQGASPVEEDAEVVERLRRQGALLIGKANMQEIGIGVFGHNPHYGPARNPYDPARYTGGSSSGPAAAVAAGLCPVAVAADGGGSIRIPAALCGQVGLKPTFGRVSERGAAPLCWSVAHVGPIAASVRDAALGYAVMAGHDAHDPNSQGHPAPSLEGVFSTAGLEGMRLGVYRSWFEHAEPDVVAVCQSLLDKLAEAGAEVVEIQIPELAMVRTVHLITIVSEMLASQLPFLGDHRSKYALETRVNLALAGRLTGYDYVHAQRLRVRCARHFQDVLEKVDAIVTPATACTAPVIAADAVKSGESNLDLLGRLMRYVPAANLTGLPAISFPAGYDEQGLPVGMQVMGRAWDEQRLLRIAAVAEGVVERRRPAEHHRLLTDEG